VRLSKEEKYALRRERDVPLAERGMWTVIATVSLAAFLQGTHIFLLHVAFQTKVVRVLAVVL